jgi:hypothetical protein
MLATFFVSWVLLSGLSVLWSLATPIAAAPDEPAHMVKAASIALGEYSGAFGRDGTKVDVPEYVAWTHAQTCTANNEDATADCIPAVPGDPDAIVESATTAGLYNPLYYLLVGWPTLLSGDSSGVYAMRIVSAVIAAGFLALAAMMISTWRHRALPLIALGVTITPMVLFLSGTVNPNSVEIAATLAAFTAILSVVIQADPRLLTSRSAIAAVAGLVAANMRGLSPLWVAVAVLAPLLLADRDRLRMLIRSTAVRIAAGVIAASAIFAVIWVLTSNSLAAHVDPATTATEVPYFGASPVTGFFLMLAQLGNQMREMVGVFGWLDTAAPTEVYILWTLLIGGLVISSLLLLKTRQRLFVAVLAGSFVILPALAQAAFIRGGGFIWQGRYALPLLAILLIGAGTVLAKRFDSLPPDIARTLILGTGVAWAAAQSYAFASVLHRYAVGAHGPWPELFLAPRWAPPGGAILLVAVFLALGIATSWAAIRLAATRPTRLRG